MKTKIWGFTHVLEGAKIGYNCRLNEHVFVENEVVIGNNATIKCGVYIWDGITIEDYVFVGPSVTFTNDKHPRSKKYTEEFEETILKTECSIRANATILCGIIIGEYATIGAGAVVTKNVKPYEPLYNKSSIKYFDFAEFSCLSVWQFLNLKNQ